MPLTATGTKVLGSMRETYGSNKKAEQVFYSSINANKPGSSKWHKMKKKKGLLHKKKGLLGH